MSLKVDGCEDDDGGGGDVCICVYVWYVCGAVEVNTIVSMWKSEGSFQELFSPTAMALGKKHRS